MKVTITERGFKHVEPLLDDYSGTIRVYESSNSKGPCLWLSIQENPDVLIEPLPGKATSHLTVEQAEDLIERLRYIIDNHYQLIRAIKEDEGVEPWWVVRWNYGDEGAFVRAESRVMARMRFFSIYDADNCEDYWFEGPFAEKPVLMSDAQAWPLKEED